MRVRDREAEAEELTEFCRGKISHQKVPARVRIVGEFPMTVTGKIQKFTMRDIESGGAGETSKDN